MFKSLKFVSAHNLQNILNFRWHFLPCTYQQSNCQNVYIKNRLICFAEFNTVGLMLYIVVVKAECDCAAINARKRGITIGIIDEQLRRLLQCLLHGNERPLWQLLETFDGTATGHGRFLSHSANCWQIIKHAGIASKNSEFFSTNIGDLRNNQQL